jgi:PTS system nitrogen regulatory IIA component
MQLSIRDLTNLLDVTESTISQWIRERGLPARRAGRHYRVNRADLLRWAASNNVRVSQLLFDHLDADDRGLSRVVDALQAGGIHYRLPGGDRQGALASLVGVLPLPPNVDRADLLRLFLARGTAGFTAVGDGIAIPQVTNPIILDVPRPAATLAFFDSAIELGAAGERPVHALFSIVSPTNRVHLQLLTRLSFSVHDAGFRQAVARAAPREQIEAELRRVEGCMCVSAAEAARLGY